MLAILPLHCSYHFTIYSVSHRLYHVKGFIKIIWFTVDNVNQNVNHMYTTIARIQKLCCNDTFNRLGCYKKIT